MAETSSRLTTISTVVALMGSLFGNWLQYQALGQKETELQQAQSKLTADTEATKVKRERLESQVGELENRLREKDMQIRSARSDLGNATLGAIVGTTPEQKELAIRKGQATQQVLPQLEQERNSIQQQLDNVKLLQAGCQATS